MDGDIEVLEQLGEDVEQCLTAFAREMQLYQIQIDILSKEKEDTEKQEEDLTRRIKQLKEKRMACIRETALMHEQLDEESREFQKLTSLAAEQLSHRALQMETARLKSLIRDLEEQEKRLTDEMAGRTVIDEAAVFALVEQTLAVQKRSQRLCAENERLCAEVRAVVADATKARARLVGRREEDNEEEICRQLEEAIEDMTLLRVDMELSEGAGSDRAEGPRQHLAVNGAPVEGMQVQAALTRVAVLRDDCDAELQHLATVLEDRVERNRKLAEELGLLENDVNELDSSTTSVIRCDSDDRAAEFAVDLGLLAPSPAPAQPPSSAKVTTALSMQGEQTENVLRIEQISLDSDSE